MLIDDAWSPAKGSNFGVSCAMMLQDFIYEPVLNKAATQKKVDKFDLNSLYYEPGQKSYMREAIAYQVLQ